MQNYPVTGFSCLSNPYQSNIPFHQALPEKTIYNLSGTTMYKMKVGGKGSISVEPDTAEVVMGVTTENRQLRLAQEQNARTAAVVIRTLEDMGIPSDDIQTQAYNITPQYDYVEGTQVFRGYRVIHTFRVTIREVAKVGEIIDAAVGSGANTIENISFTVDQPTEYYQMALKAAIDDAYLKAQTIAKKLMVQLLPYPIQIIEESKQGVTPVPYAYMQAAQVSTPIQAGRIEITAQITAIFAYSPVSG